MATALARPQAFATAAAAFLLFGSTGGLAADRQAAIVADVTSGQVLFAEAADEPRFPASLTKMMTLYLVFQELEHGRLQLGSPLSVSAHAASQVPTKLGLRAGQTISVDEAIKALVVQSANDVAVVVAENLEGVEQSFAGRMTRAAQSLGMSRTRFRNASGLPDAGQYSTARDMMVLGAALQAHFPQYFGYFRIASFTFQSRRYASHNRLVGRLEGVNGIKTGYTRASGFNVVTSLQRNGRAVIAVVMGGRSARSRDQEVEALLATALPQSSFASAAAGL